MPIYEYVCKQCGTRSEVLQKASEPAPATCPSCGAAATLERVVSRTSFHLKGGGWAADNYGSTRKSDAGKDSKPDAKPAEGKPVEGKPAEAKPKPAETLAPAAPAPAKPSGGSD